MAETQVASIGWGGEVHLHNGTTLFELKEVTGFKPPSNVRERVDATHLKSAGRRRKMIAGLYETTSVDVTMNYRPGSDTDVLCRAAVAAANEREAKFVIPMDGEPNVDIEPDAVVATGYDVDELSVDGVMQATLTLEIVGDLTQGAAS